jgi:hypothetical protein
VSTLEQDPALQHDALLAAGVQRVCLTTLRATSLSGRS